MKWIFGLILFILFIFISYILSRIGKRKNKYKHYDTPYRTEYESDLSPEARKIAGEKFEKAVGKDYEENGYKVDYRGLKLGIKDGGIDLIATKGNTILLIQCKNWKEENSITHRHIKEFYGNCHFYIDKELQNTDKKIICIFACSSQKAMDKSAVYLCKANYEKCRYKVFDSYNY